MAIKCQAVPSKEPHLHNYQKTMPAGPAKLSRLCGGLRPTTKEGNPGYKDMSVSLPGGTWPSRHGSAIHPVGLRHNNHARASSHGHKIHKNCLEKREHGVVVGGVGHDIERYVDQVTEETGRPRPLSALEWRVEFPYWDGNLHGNPKTTEQANNENTANSVAETNLNANANAMAVTSSANSDALPTTGMNTIVARIA